MTVHATYTDDPDKAVCGVRISQNPDRKAATLPVDCTCERCCLRLLRTWQKGNPDFDVVKWKNAPWPAGVGGAPGKSW